MDTEDKVITGVVSLLAVLFLLVFSVLFIGSHFEAKTYTRLTGVEVTYWDAFFMELDPSKHVIMIEKDK